MGVCGFVGRRTVARSLWAELLEFEQVCGVGTQEGHICIGFLAPCWYV